MTYRRYSKGQRVKLREAINELRYADASLGNQQRRYIDPVKQRPNDLNVLERAKNTDCSLTAERGWGMSSDALIADLRAIYDAQDAGDESRAEALARVFDEKLAKSDFIIDELMDKRTTSDNCTTI